MYKRMQTLITPNKKKRSARRVLFYHESTVWNTAVVSLIQSLSASTETLLLKRVVQGPGSLYGSELCINSNVRKCRITASICTFGIKLPQLKLLLTARGDLLGNVDLTAVVGMYTALKWLFFKFQRHFLKPLNQEKKHRDVGILFFLESVVRGWSWRTCHADISSILRPEHLKCEVFPRRRRNKQTNLRTLMGQIWPGSKNIICCSSLNNLNNQNPSHESSDSVENVIITLLRFHLPRWTSPLHLVLDVIRPSSPARRCRSYGLELFVRTTGITVLFGFSRFEIKRCSLRLLKCIWSYRLGGMMNRCARLMQRKRWLHDSGGTLQNTGHLCSDLYIEKSDTESAPAIFQISHFNESHLYVHDFTVHRGRTSIEAGGISLKVSDWSTSSGSTSFCLCISLPLLFLLHACESNYRLSFLVKKIQISIIESRWCGSMCVCGGEEGVRITGHLYLNEACVTRWSGHSMEPAGGC